MAFLNRTEVQAAIQALAAIVGETEHKDSLDPNFAASVVFRKDVAAADTAGSGSKTLDFQDVDYISCSQSSSPTSYTLSNIQQGEIKFLRITKSATFDVTFANATDVSVRTTHINTSVTEVVYRITNKNASLYVEAISVSNSIANIQADLTTDWNNTPNDPNATFTFSDSLVERFGPRKVIQLEGTIAFSSNPITSGTTLLEFTGGDYSADPDVDIYGFIHIDHGSGFVAYQVRLNTDGDVILEEDTASIGSAVPYGLTLNY